MEAGEIAAVPARGTAPAGSDLVLNLRFFESARFAPALERYMAEHGLTRERALAHFMACAQFLAVCARSPEPVSPSRPIDQAWHAFILVTRRYTDYCATQFGRYIHHASLPAPKKGTSSYPRAYVLAVALFGRDALDPELWHDPTAPGADCKPPGTCHGQCCSE